jgi:hypothetical protein
VSHTIDTTTAPAAPQGRPSRSAGRRVAATTVVLLVVLGVCLSSRVAWVATADVGPQIHQEQLDYLEQALDHGAAEQTQGTFGEGFFFTHVLTGLAAAQPARPGDRKALAAVRRALAAVRSPAGEARFAGQDQPVNGVFWAGWTLLLSVEQARLTGAAPQRQQVRIQATAIMDALVADDDGILESYPGMAWPVDNMVAVAALARADALVTIPGAAAAVAAWPSRIAGLRDPATGLLPHQLGPDGTAPERPRGASQALLLAFEPEVDARLAAEDYRRFVAAFVVRRLGLVGVREYPIGTPGGADANSGPLLWGVSASASAVTLAVAARQQDRELAQALNAEAELLGLPITWHGRRRYGGGALPVGDAFLAWARSQPPSPTPTGSLESPRPLWLVWGVVPLLPGAFATALLIRSRTRRPHQNPRDHAKLRA